MSQHYTEMLRRCASQVGVWYDDPAGAQMAAEMARLGLPVQARNKEVQAGIDTVHELMASNRLKVFRTCADWQSEVGSYAWQKSPAGDFKDQPVKLDDDLMDGTRCTPG